MKLSVAHVADCQMVGLFVSSKFGRFWNKIVMA
jgi:hypothetical protein